MINSIPAGKYFKKLTLVSPRLGMEWLSFIHEASDWEWNCLQVMSQDSWTWWSSRYFPTSMTLWSATETGLLATRTESWALKSLKLYPLFLEYCQLEGPGWVSAKTPFKTKLTMHSLSTRHTSGLYRRLLSFGQSVETLDTSGNTRARNKRGLELKSLLQVKCISSILTGFQINLVLK